MNGLVEKLKMRKSTVVTAIVALSAIVAATIITLTVVDAPERGEMVAQLLGMVAPAYAALIAVLKSEGTEKEMNGNMEKRIRKAVRQEMEKDYER